MAKKDNTLLLAGGLGVLAVVLLGNKGGGGAGAGAGAGGSGAGAFTGGETVPEDVPEAWEFPAGLGPAGATHLTLTDIRSVFNTTTTVQDEQNAARRIESGAARQGIQQVIDRTPFYDTYADYIAGTHIQTIEDVRGTSFDTATLRQQQAAAARRATSNEMARASFRANQAAGVTTGQQAAAARALAARRLRLGLGSSPGGGPGETAPAQTPANPKSPGGPTLADIRKKYQLTGGTRATGYGPGRGS